MPVGGPVVGGRRRLAPPHVRLSLIWYVWFVAGTHLGCRSVAMGGPCSGGVERLCNFTKELDSDGNLKLACECGNSTDPKTMIITKFVIAFQGGRHHQRDIAELNKTGCFVPRSEKVEKILPGCDCCKDHRKFSVKLLDLEDCDDGIYTCTITFPQRDGDLNCNETLQWQAPRTTPTNAQLVTTAEETTAAPRAENIRESDQKAQPSTSILIIVIVVAAVVIVIVIVTVFIIRGRRRLGHHLVNSCPEVDEDGQLVPHLDANANDDMKDVDEKKVRGLNRARDKARLDHCVNHLDNAVLVENLRCQYQTTLGDTIMDEVRLVSPETLASFCEFCGRGKRRGQGCGGRGNEREDKKNDKSLSGVVALIETPAVLSPGGRNTETTTVHKGSQGTFGAATQICPPGHSPGSVAGVFAGSQCTNCVGRGCPQHVMDRHSLGEGASQGKADKGQGLATSTSACTRRTCPPLPAGRLHYFAKSGACCTQTKKPTARHHRHLSPNTTHALPEGDSAVAHRELGIDSASVTHGWFSNRLATERGLFVEAALEAALNAAPPLVASQDLSQDELSRLKGKNSENPASSSQHAVTPRSVCCSGGSCDASTHSQDGTVNDDAGDKLRLRSPVPCHHHCCCRHKGFCAADSRPPNCDTSDFSSHDGEERKCRKGGCREDESAAWDTTDTPIRKNAQTVGTSRRDVARGKWSHTPSAGTAPTSLNAQTLMEADGSHHHSNNSQVQLRDNETHCKRPLSAKGDNLGLPVTCASDDFAQRDDQAEVNGHDPLTVIGRVQRTESGRCDPRKSSSKRGVPNPQTDRGHKPRFCHLNITLHNDSVETRGSSTRSQQSDRPSSSSSSLGSRHSTSLKVPLSTTC